VKLNYKKRKTVYFYSVKGIIQYEPKYMLNDQKIRGQGVKVVHCEFLL